MNDIDFLIYHCLLYNVVHVSLFARPPSRVAANGLAHKKSHFAYCQQVRKHYITPIKEPIVFKGVLP